MVDAQFSACTNISSKLSINTNICKVNFWEYKMWTYGLCQHKLIETWDIFTRFYLVSIFCMSAFNPCNAFRLMGRYHSTKLPSPVGKPVCWGNDQEFQEYSVSICQHTLPHGYICADTSSCRHVPTRNDVPTVSASVILIIWTFLWCWHVSALG